MDKKQIIDILKKEKTVSDLVEKDLENKKYIKAIAGAIKTIDTKISEIEKTSPSLFKKTTDNIKILDEKLNKTISKLDVSITSLKSTGQQSTKDINKLQSQAKTLQSEFNSNAQLIADEIQTVKKIIKTYSIALAEKPEEIKSIVDAYLQDNELVLNFSDGEERKVGKIKIPKQENNPITPQIAILTKQIKSLKDYVDNLPSGGNVYSVNGKTGTVVLNSTDIGLGNVPNLSFSGSNTGDETESTIKSKLGITTLSGTNTGDQILPTLSSLNGQELLVSGTNIKTINSTSILGSGDIVIGGTSTGDMLKSTYDTTSNGVVDNAEKVSGFTVGTNVPSDAVFTDTITTIVNNLTETVTGKALDATQGKTLNDGKSNKSTIVNATLSSASWVGSVVPFSYTLSVTGVTSTSIQELLPSTSITLVQLNTLQLANIQDYSQSTNTIVLYAWGTKPTIDLPIRVILRGDM